MTTFHFPNQLDEEFKPGDTVHWKVKGFEEHPFKGKVVRNLSPARSVVKHEGFQEPMGLRMAPAEYVVHHKNIFHHERMNEETLDEGYKNGDIVHWKENPTGITSGVVNGSYEHAGTDWYHVKRHDNNKIVSISHHEIMHHHKPMKEEIDQLNEISKEKLEKYHNKLAGMSGKHSMFSKNEFVKNKRWKGYIGASARLDGEPVSKNMRDKYIMRTIKKEETQLDEVRTIKGSFQPHKRYSSSEFGTWKKHATKRGLVTYQDENGKHHAMSGHDGKHHGDFIEGSGGVLKEETQLDEAEMHVKAGAFHKWLGKSPDEKITAADIAKGKAAGGHPAKMATFAQNIAHIGEETMNENVKVGDSGRLNLPGSSVHGLHATVHQVGKESHLVHVHAVDKDGKVVMTRQYKVPHSATNWLHEETLDEAGDNPHHEAARAHTQNKLKRAMRKHMAKKHGK